MDKVSGFWALLDALGNKPDEKRTRSTATYSGTDSDGTPWVTFPGSSEPTPVRGSVTSDLSMGDEVEVEVSNGRVSIVGNNTDPSLGTKAVARAIAPALEKAEQTERIAREATEGVAAAQTAVKAATDAATQAAANAQAAIEASDQHFFSDSNGVHVSTEEDAPTGTRNILINSLGVILRKASTILAQFTEGEVAFYDGDGNGAANVVAAFGASGAQVGKSNSTHISINGDELRLECSNGAPAIQMNADESEASLCHLSFVGDGVTRSFIAQEPYTLSGNHRISSSVTIMDGAVVNATVQMTQQVSGITVSGTFFDSTNFPDPPESGSIIDVYVSIDTRAAVTIGSRRGDIGGNSLAVGYLCEASGRNSAAIGSSRANGDNSLAAGSITYATGECSAAFGDGCESGGDCSFTAGRGLRALSDNQAVIGKNNIPDGNGDYAFIIGNGTSTAVNDRGNALTVDWDGNVECASFNGVTFDNAGSILSETDTTDVSTSTNTDVASITLTAGTWLVNARLQFASNSTGRRAAKLSTTSADSANVISTDARNAVDGGATNIQTERLFALSSQSTVYLIGWQNSGSTLSCAGDIQAVRLAVMNDVPFSTVYTSSSAPTSAQGSDGDVWLVV